jgi:hypothetical protein
VNYKVNEWGNNFMEEIRKAITIGANIDNQKNFVESMKELSNLAEACDIEVVGELTQNLSHENRAHYLGKGKIEEVSELISAMDVGIVIFDEFPEYFIIVAVALSLILYSKSPLFEAPTFDISPAFTPNTIAIISNIDKTLFFIIHPLF